MRNDLMKYKCKNEISINEIKSMIDYCMNTVIEIFRDISIDEATGIFENNIDIIIVKVDKDDNILLVDKDILFELMLKKIDVKKSVFQFGSKDYCLLDNGFNNRDTECKFIVVRDSVNRINGVFKKTILENLLVVSNAKHSVIKNIINRNIEDDNAEITINKIMPLKDAKYIVERELITKVMNRVKSTYKAAKILEVSQATIARKSKKYNDEIFC